MKRLLSFVFLFMLSPSYGNEDSFPLPFEITSTEGSRVSIVSPKWHQRDGSWLFTCRLEAEAERLVKPVAHLLFEGFGEVAKDQKEEPVAVWQHTHVTRRKFFDRNYGTRVGAFTRVIIDDIPSEVKTLKIKFVNEPPTKSSD